MLVERIQIKRLRIVDRVRQNKLRELEVKFMKQVSIGDEDPNVETQALFRAELGRARVNSEFLVNTHCDSAHCFALFLCSRIMYSFAPCARFNSALRDSSSSRLSV